MNLKEGGYALSEGDRDFDECRLQMESWWDWRMRSFMHSGHASSFGVKMLKMEESLPYYESSQAVFGTITMLLRKFSIRELQTLMYP